MQSHIESEPSHKVQALVLKRFSSYKPPSFSPKFSPVHLQGLQLADPQYLDQSHVDVLLGAAFYSSIVEGSVVKGQPQEPIAIKTTLGWIILGNVPTEGNSVSLHTSCESSRTSESSLDTLLQRFWNQEEVSSKPLLSSSDQWCEDYFVNTHSRDSTGRYYVRLSFKDVQALNNLNLGESKFKACRMLFQMESKFRRE